MVSAHLAAAERASKLGFGKYIISATTPFQREDLRELNSNAVAIVLKRCPGYQDIYHQLGWTMFDKIDRVYVNKAAREDLGWQPRYDFDYILTCLQAGQYPRSSLSIAVGSKGYHDRTFTGGPYPVE